ncbi:hypothetical protein B9K09_11645 [Pseudomonas sp. M30-35]|nr:hypothetical protein [Pseudomonas sp. M30-35]ARU88576.1 hypothetical protein B9K09_11645 [Pseudomonas sp. M30-35]
MLDLLTYIFAELLLRCISFPIGWPLVKLFTLGRYPTKGSWFADRPETQWTAGIGLAVLVLVLMIMLKQLVDW